MSGHPRNPLNYTVGWVCALPKEQTAAMTMLEQIHPDVQKPPNDPNTYTLGSIGKHNVVITCLPKGKIGTNPAATAMAWLASTFPSVKFALMVGIGGGIPPNVRLGDVVVSAPVDRYSGVVQWDFGKAKQGEDFQMTGFLSGPPNSLLTALAKLETEREMNSSTIPNYLEELKQNWPKLAPKYLKSNLLEDMLFKANYKHISNSATDPNEGDGGSCRFCSKDQIIMRKPRDMRVHYGLIASGNQVVKDAAVRDSLNRRFGGHVLCIEMEAAGIMTNFPCIVIRGICDYADSHKNKDWQEHAAAVAAALARELLQYVQPSEVDKEPTANETIHRAFLIPNFTELQRSLNEMEILCARLNNQLSERKEIILNLRVNIKKTKKRRTKARSFSAVVKWKEKHNQLTRELRRAENKEDRIWRRLDKAESTTQKVRQQLTSAMRDTSFANVENFHNALRDGVERGTNWKGTRQNEAQIYVVRPKKTSWFFPANGIHRFWKF